MVDAAALAPLRFEVAASDPKGRLDKLVVELLSRAGAPTSRAVVQRWIEHGRVLVGGAPAKSGAAVAEGAIIEVSPEPPEPSSAAPDPTIDLPVVYEDPHLLIVDKPAGLVVHPARGHAAGTLVNALLARPGFERAGADPRDPAGHLRPGIVHRLDKGTSGLLVVAKDEATREALKDLFAKHAIDREYAAVVVGAAKDATYDTLHGRHPTDRLRFTSHVDAGRRAVTHVRVLERLGPASLVACRLDTGRTHQIRVHLAERASTPILADPLYGRAPKDQALRAIAEDLGRQALHARVLGFVHPKTGDHVRWESPLPADMSRAIERLRELAALAALAARATKSSI
jgi:23S rRNA pseudouridine1911/1915/1917 synthase